VAGRSTVIYAVSDVHSPVYLAQYRSSLRNSSYDRGAGLILFAGDMVENGKVDMLKPVVEATRQAFPRATIIAVFGNEEYPELEPRLRALYPGITWLDDEVYYYTREGYTLAVVGSRGSIDRPTRWQKRNIPGITTIYRRRAEKIGELLRQAMRESDQAILLTHYATAKCTLKGEPPRSHPFLYSSLIEKIILRMQPHAVIHGHAHHGNPYCRIGLTPVYNVAFPLNGSLTRIKPRPSLSII